MSSKLFIIADCHFGHFNIIKYCNRPFNSVGEMNYAMIENWNKTVKPGDRVIVNGDFALCGKDRLIDIGQQLNGRKTLIVGNHDEGSLETYYRAGFEMVSKNSLVIDNFYIVSHYPLIEGGAGWGSFCNIYGHVHNHDGYEDVTRNTFCSSAERIEYTPILFDDIVIKMERAAQANN